MSRNELMLVNSQNTNISSRFPDSTTPSMAPVNSISSRKKRSRRRSADR